MTTLFRSIRLIALAAWVGSLVFFGFVAQVAFTSLPDTHQAGLIVRGSLIALHHLGLIAGLVYLVFTLALLATQSDTHPVRAAELALVIAMLALTAYSQFSVIPHMEKDRVALAMTAPDGVDSAPPANPMRLDFDRLHSLSVKLEGAVLIEGLILLVLATMHGHDYRDRFA